MSEHPEHDRMALIADQSQAIGEFLDTSGYTLAEWAERDDCPCPSPHPHLTPVARSIEGVLADYFGIDQAKIEQEKRAMLDDLRRNR